MTPLCELARKFRTDKGGEHYLAGDMCHAYTPVYHELFKDRRDVVSHVLEIGVNYGCSLRMWEEYFPNARIVGLDSNAEALIHGGGRKRCIAADQGNEQSLLDAIITAGQLSYDLIVDDGSHELGHQILTMQTLLSFLAEDGFYVIEDMTIDCKPELITDHLPLGYKWEAIVCGPGLGTKPVCGCGCGGPERLLVIRHG